MKTIVVHRPLMKRNTPFGVHVHRLYDQICNVLKAHNVPFQEQLTKDRDLRKDDSYNHITYHTRNKAKNFLNVKMSYLKTYFYIDEYGFSGWSEIARKEFDPSHIDNDDANAYFEKLQNRYVSTKESKYSIIQSHDNSDIPDGAMVVFLQVFSDIVMRHALISNEEMVRAAFDAAGGQPLVIKRHPLCKEPESAELIEQALTWGPNVSVTNCAVHEILEKADTVVCVNSGAGFEALLHERHVITMGNSDYTHATAKLDLDKGIAEVFERPRHDPQVIRNFLYWYLNSQVIDVEAPNAEAQIEEKLTLKGWI